MEQKDEIVFDVDWTNILCTESNHIPTHFMLKKPRIYGRLGLSEPSKLAGKGKLKSLVSGG